VEKSNYWVDFVFHRNITWGSLYSFYLCDFCVHYPGYRLNLPNNFFMLKDKNGKLMEVAFLWKVLPDNFAFGLDTEIQNHSYHSKPVIEKSFMTDAAYQSFFPAVVQYWCIWTLSWHQHTNSKFHSEQERWFPR
jgi:hypothetical protein